MISKMSYSSHSLHIQDRFYIYSFRNYDASISEISFLCNIKPGFFHYFSVQNETNFAKLIKATKSTIFRGNLRKLLVKLKLWFNSMVCGISVSIMLWRQSLGQSLKISHVTTNHLFSNQLKRHLVNK